jgi:hypothetical protein
MTTAEMLASATHVCTTSDTDDGIGGLTGVFDVRAGVMTIWSNVQLAQSLVMHYKGGDPERPLSVRNSKLNIDGMRMFLMYCVEHPGRRRRKPVDVNDMIEKWLPIIRGLATGHDKATVDQCEFDSEEHLLPLTSAPVAQLRDFYRQLCDRLEADPTIPFFVWRSFRTWGDVILDKLPDKGVKQLRGDLAKRVADLVEKDITPDLNAALTGALQWRDAETLQKIETAVKAGARPRMVGRESCLFLQVETPDGVSHTVML